MAVKIMDQMFRYTLLGICIAFSTLGLAQNKKAVLSMEEAIGFAVDRNLSIKLGEVNADLAKEGEKQAKMSFLPSVNAFGSHGYNWGQTIDPFTNTFASSRVQSNSFALSSNWTLFGGMQRHYTLAQRKAESKASELELDQSRNDVSINVAQAYLTAVYNQELLAIAVEQLALSNQQYDRVKQQYEIGQVSMSTLLDIEAQKANDELSLTNSKNQYQLSRLQFFQMIQSTEEEQRMELELPDLTSVNAKVVSSTPKSLYNSALEALPDVKASEYRLLASEKGLSAARGSYIPQLSMNASYGSGYSGNNVVGVGDPVLRADTVPGLYTTNGAQLIQISPEFNTKTKAFKDQINDNFNQSLSFSLNIPLFNGGNTRTNVNRSKLNVLQTKIQLDQAKNTLRQKVETAWNDALAAYQRLQSSEKAAIAQQQSFDNAQIRFEENLITSVDFNDFKVRLARSQADFVQAKVDYIFKSKVLDFYKGENLSLR
ncbi:MAG: outer membrane protein [Sphingobacteriales bacterium]